MPTSNAVHPSYHPVLTNQESVLLDSRVEIARARESLS
jgi:hypothetical protein